MSSRRRIASAVIALAILLPTALTHQGATGAEARATTPEDRYAMAGGCYTIQASGGAIARSTDGFVVGGAAEPFFFQATDLGSYLLYGTARDFIASSEGAAGAAAYGATKSSGGQIVGGVTIGTTDTAADAIARSPVNDATGRGASVVAAKEANELADWTIDEASAGVFTIVLPAVGKALASDGARLSLAAKNASDQAQQFTFTLASGCTAFPEIEVNVDDSMVQPSSPVGEVRGTVDAHLHMMAYEFIGGRVRCGQPWNRYGVDSALVDCADHGPHGETAALEYVLSGGSPATGHSPNGWPTFEGWPKPGSLTHEQVYYKWLERAYRSGLRLMTLLLVDNHALCVAYPLKKNSCNEMDGVRLQAKRARELERYIDAQSGGPGEGWFRIVTDPFQAREVANSGKLAVVLGIEVSTPFDCGLIRGIPNCDEAKIDRGLDEVYGLGVRQMELANKFDNALTGITGDAHEAGVVVNQGNMSETGSYWRMGTCPDDAGDATDKPQYNARDLGAPEELTGRDSIFGGVLEVSGTSGVAPVYPQGPHCNTMGLTELGEYAVKGLAQRGMIFDPDHMSALARTQSLDVVEEIGYSGVVSSHSWADDTNYPRILKFGGVVTPHAGGSTGFKNAWERLRTEADPRYYFGFGFGSDVNGFSKQGSPRNPADGVTYPFVGLSGAVVGQQKSGTRTYNVNRDGVAHYGLYADWLQDLRLQGGEAIMNDMARGAEAYLQMWERAIGIAPDACRSDIADLTPAQAAAATTGMTAKDVLEAIGQPASRVSNQYVYCTTSGNATVAFGGNALVSSVSIP